MQDEINPYRSPSSSTPADREEDIRPREIMHGRLVTLATFVESVDAHLFRNELDSHGINAAITNENSTAIFGATIAGQSAAFTIEVMVMESDAAKGLEIKERWHAARAGSETAEQEIEEWTCRCGETVDAGFAVCWNCDSLHGSEDCSTT